MDRRSFLKMIVGGVATAAAVRTFPFRVFSFPKEVSCARGIDLASGPDLTAISLISLGPVMPRRLIVMHPDEMEALRTFREKYGRASWDPLAQPGLRIVASPHVRPGSPLEVPADFDTPPRFHFPVNSLVINRDQKPLFQFR